MINSSSCRCKANILDDIGIARALAEANRKYHCLYLDQMFRCRTYTNFFEIWEGWTKNIFAGDATLFRMSYWRYYSHFRSLCLDIHCSS